MHRLIERAGEAPFPDDVIRTLAEPINDSLVDIRPDGLIYVSHPHYRDRLDAAFGVGGWALVPLAAPKVSGNRVIYYGFLKARGQYIGDAFGGAEYLPQNRNGNFDNSAEAAKSDCLVRCCKALPIFRECWDKEYADFWKATYAEQVGSNGGRGPRVWRKKGTAMRGFSARPDRDPESEFRKIATVDIENAAHMAAIKEEGRLRIGARDVHNENEPGYDDNDDALRAAYESEMADKDWATSGKEEF